MAKRSKMSSNGSKKLFTKTASYVHPKNSMPSALPMRGGIRL